MINARKKILYWFELAAAVLLLQIAGEPSLLYPCIPLQSPRHMHSSCTNTLRNAQLLPAYLVSNAGAAPRLGCKETEQWGEQQQSGIPAG